MPSFPKGKPRKSMGKTILSPMVPPQERILPVQKFLSTCKTVGRNFPIYSFRPSRILLSSRSDVSWHHCTKIKLARQQRQKPSSTLIVDMIYEPTVRPPQSGMTRPGFKFRPGSISPHRSSHSWPGVLNMTFQGSSNASNLSRKSVGSLAVE